MNCPKPHWLAELRFLCVLALLTFRHKVPWWFRILTRKTQFPRHMGLMGVHPRCPGRGRITLLSL